MPEPSNPGAQHAQTRGRSDRSLGTMSIAGSFGRLRRRVAPRQNQASSRVLAYWDQPTNYSATQGCLRPLRAAGIICCVSNVESRKANHRTPAGRVTSAAIHGRQWPRSMRKRQNDHWIYVSLHVRLRSLLEIRSDRLALTCIRRASCNSGVRWQRAYLHAIAGPSPDKPRTRSSVTSCAAW